MSEIALPGASFNALLEGAPSGMVGSLGVSVIDLDGVVVVARTTNNIAEIETGVYRKSGLVAPVATGEFVISWDVTGSLPVTEDLQVVETLPETVTLNFIPPNIANLVELRVYESESSNGAWIEIDSTSDIGTYPEYISEFTTSHALNGEDWFAVRWEDAAGNLTDLSTPIQGESSVYVQQLTDRIMLRDPSVPEEVARQEAEAVLELVFGTTTPESVSALQFSGLTALALGRIYLTNILTTEEGTQYVAGLVSQKSGSTSSATLKAVQDMMKQAAAALGLNYSVVAHMVEPVIANGSVASVDVSRLLIEIE